MVKWLIHTEDHINSFGGVANFSLNLADRLNKGDISVLLYSDNTIFVKNEQYNPAWNIYKKVKTLLALPFFLRTTGISTYFLQYVPYSYSRFGIPFYLIPYLLFLRFLNINIYIYFHEIAVRKTDSRLVFKMLAYLQLFIAKCLVKIAHNQYTSNLYYKELLNKSTCKVVPVPSNLEKSSLAFSFLSKSDTIEILSFTNRCTLSLLKGLDILSQSGYNLELKLVGNSIKKHISLIESFIPHSSYRIQIIPPGKRELLIHAFEQANIYCQIENVNNRNEGGASTKSGALAAAFQFGKIIITTRGDMTDSEFINDDVVFFVNGRDKDKIAFMIGDVIDNYENSLKKAFKASQYYNDKISWNNFIKSILDANRYSE